MTEEKKAHEWYKRHLKSEESSKFNVGVAENGYIVQYKDIVQRDDSEECVIPNTKMRGKKSIKIK